MRKMVVRADDVGYTDVCNIGTFETITNGIVTSADIMLDAPGTEDALKRLKELPWISIGWQPLLVQPRPSSGAGAHAGHPRYGSVPPRPHHRR